MTDLEAIPAFLRLSAEERTAAWRGRKLTTMRNEGPKGDPLHKQQMTERKRRTRQRLAVLKKQKAR